MLERVPRDCLLLAPSHIHLLPLLLLPLFFSRLYLDEATNRAREKETRAAKKRHKQQDALWELLRRTKVVKVDSKYTDIKSALSKEPEFRATPEEDRIAVFEDYLEKLK